MTHGAPAELAEVLAEIVPGGGPAGGVPRGAAGGAFGHRQHVHLAFIAVRRYGPVHAPDKVSGWPTRRRLPRRGCRTVCTMPSACTCGSANTSSMA